MAESLKEVLPKIYVALNEFYREDFYLIEHDLGERCLTYRFGWHLQKQFDNYFVDCEYNKSHLNGTDDVKIVSNPNGNSIDIILTKRDGIPENDFICFEIKKSNNYRGRRKDRENLEILTRQDKFCYKYGFYIIFARERNERTLEIYQNGTRISS